MQPDQPWPERLIAESRRGDEAARGRLPVEFSTSGLRYEAEAADDMAAAVADLQAQFDDLEATTAVLAERLDAASRRP